MSKPEGTRAVEALQQAYGFQTDLPLWDPLRLFDKYVQIYPGINEIRGIKPGKLMQVFNTWTVGDARISAGTHSGIYAAAERPGVTKFTIQYAGICEAVQGNVKMSLHPFRHGMLLVDAPVTARSTDVSWLALEVDPKRLEATAQTMYGCDSPTIDLHPRMVEFDTPGMRRYIAQLPYMIAGFEREPRLAQDTLDRLLAQLLIGDPLAGKRSRRQAAKSMAVNIACAYMMDRMREEVTLTDVERVSLLSARVLQMEFRSRFGVSPMGWLLGRRLERAQRLICSGTPGLTVAVVARECGLRHLGRFAAAFRARFGVLPSELLARRP